MSLAQLVETGGSVGVTGLTAPAVIKAAPGRLVRIIVTASNAGDVATFNDAATLGAAAAGNAILNIPAATAVNTIFDIEWPCMHGIVLSAVGGGTFSVSYF